MQKYTLSSIHDLNMWSIYSFTQQLPLLVLRLFCTQIILLAFTVIYCSSITYGAPKALLQATELKRMNVQLRGQTYCLKRHGSLKRGIHLPGDHTQEGYGLKWRNMIITGSAWLKKSALESDVKILGYDCKLQDKSKSQSSLSARTSTPMKVVRRVDPLGLMILVDSSSVLNPSSSTDFSDTSKTNDPSQINHQPVSITDTPLTVGEELYLFNADTALAGRVFITKSGAGTFDFFGQCSGVLATGTPLFSANGEPRAIVAGPDVQQLGYTRIIPPQALTVLLEEYVKDVHRDRVRHQGVQ